VFVLEQVEKIDQIPEELQTMLGEVIHETRLSTLIHNIHQLISEQEQIAAVILDLTSDTEDTSSRQKQDREVQSQCWQIWSELSFISSNLSKPALPYKGKSAELILHQCSLEDFRMQENRQAGNGAKEIIKYILQGNLLELTGSSIDSICQLRRWVYSHSIHTSTPAASLPIVPETIVSAEVTLRSVATLEDSRWINSEILNCYFVQHALCTGGCCSQFPQPIPRCEPHVFYSDTYFIPYFVVEGRRWNFNLADYDFLVITGFINSNHYVSFLANIATHHLVSYDSLGHTQDHIRKQLRLWLQKESQGQSWTTEAADCPQQDNSDDCALFALMAGTYSHLDRPLAYCYSQNDMKLLRHQLVHLAVAVGNRFRGGSAWTPFQNVED
jgi:hypothetical protein